MSVGLGCGDDDSTPKKPAETSSPTTGPSTDTPGPGPGPTLSFVEVCKASAAAMVREYTCDSDVEPDKVDWANSQVPMNSYDEALAAYSKECEEKTGTVFVLGCANPNPNAWKTHYDAVASAADCNAVKSLNKPTFCSDSNNSDNIWVQACQAYAVYNWINAICDGWTAAERDAEMLEESTKCEDEQYAKEEMSFCNAPNLPGMESCIALLKAANDDCGQMDDAYDSSTCNGQMLCGL